MKRTCSTELLAPAGNFEKLNIAFQNGADAVYTGIQDFGLRKYADNLSFTELESAVRLADSLGKRVYLTLNGLSQDAEFASLSALLEKLQNRVLPHAFIAADPGVALLIKSYTDRPIHVSTQASVTSTQGALFWKELGASRVVVARELSLIEAAHIQDSCDIDVETFIHGAMCSSYSGSCIISNYTSGRDANRGGCVQNCRHQFDIIRDKGDDYFSSNLINSKDLISVDLISAILNAGLRSVKIEGRMKSNMYLANTVSVYRYLIDRYLASDNNNIPPKELNRCRADLSKVSNRTFWGGFIASDDPAKSINYDFSQYARSVDFVGTVRAVLTKHLVVEIRSPFDQTDSLEIQADQNQWQEIRITQCLDMADQPIEKLKPNILIKIPKIEHVQKLSILRKKRSVA